MTFEGLSGFKDESVPAFGAENAARRHAAERDFVSSEQLNSLGQELRELQMRHSAVTCDILNYESSLTEGGKHIMQSESPKLRELALKLGRETREKMNARQEQKDGIEKAIAEVSSKIEEMGGNPGDYKLQ